MGVDLLDEELASFDEPRRPAAGGLDQSRIREPLRLLGPRKPLCLSPDATLADAVRLMREHHVGCVLAVEHDRLVGILTERDLLLKVVGRKVDLAAPVDQFMTAGPDALTPEATMGEALALMDRGGYRHVPLVDESGQIAGLLRQQDILAYVAEAFPESILNLPPRPHQQMQEQDGA